MNTLIAVSTIAILAVIQIRSLCGERDRAKRVAERLGYELEKLGQQQRALEIIRTTK